MIMVMEDAALRDVGPFAHGRNRVVHGLLAGIRMTQLLDYGCGQAGFAIAAASELGVKVHACDIRADLVARLKDRNGAGVNFFAVSDSDPVLPLEDGQVTAVTCCDVLEHMPPASRAAALREMRRVLSDGGALVVTTPHKGLLSAADPENVKYYFPRAHRLAFSLLKGRDKYQTRYGGERFGNFSSGARRHLHFSTEELSGMLTEAGFRVEEVRYYTLAYPFVKTLLWFAESLAGRVRGARRVRALCWRMYLWDADLEPGKLAGSIGIRATKTAPAAG
jgi:ubiquinone/menaquinone biosynthesis C-methylase UbiE